jgi:hypothetical protein
MAEQKDKGLIFIPDISGFTRFVQETEIEHAGHIVSELLELLIDANQLGMEVSEIEGDAILFFRQGESPSAEAVFAQAEAMQLAFRNQLKLYERDRICQCGACTTAVDLQLKFVAHPGVFQMRHIKEHRKLFGADVILAHRLLKNSVDDDEYLLYTGLEGPGQKPSWAEIREGADEYPEIGTIPYRYASMSPFVASIPPLPPREKPVLPPVAAQTSIDIAASLDSVHHALTTDSLKLVWNQGIKKIVPEYVGAPTVGTGHRCLTSFGEFHVRTVDHENQSDHVELIEYSEKLFGLHDVYSKSKATRLPDGRTRVVLSMHFQPAKGLGRLRHLLAARLGLAGLKKSAEGLKAFCESSTYDYPTRSASDTAVA